MMKFVTCGQMKILEKRADASGLSYYQMMENAGTSAFEIICSKYESSIGDTKVLLFCGKGNNGGDGFVVARKLLEAGSDVSLVLVDGKPASKDAITTFQLIEDKLPIIDMTVTESPFMDIPGRQDILIDAIYGTGFHGKLRPNALKAAAFINQFKEKSLICSLDIPSGLNGDATNSSQIDANAVEADITITFHNKKPIHLQPFARPYCGETAIADIGIDEEALW